MSLISEISIIYNPNSTGNAEQQARDLQTSLSFSLPGTQLRLLPTKYAGHAEELAYETAKKARAGSTPLIVSASGDGGYSEVINGALRAQAEGAQPICAVLASGNANDHARTMQHLPLDQLIVKADIKQLDVLQVTMTDSSGLAVSSYAHSYIGLGLTPSVAVELNKHSLSSLKESLIVVKTFCNLRPVKVEVQNKILWVDSLICSIIPEMAKVITLSNAASARDGKFELTVLLHGTKRQLLLRLLQGVVSHMDAPSQAKDYNCRLVQAAPIQLDGEVKQLTAGTALSISLCPGLLRTLV